MKQRRSDITLLYAYAYAMIKGGYIGSENNPEYIRSKAIYELLDESEQSQLECSSKRFRDMLADKYSGKGFDVRERKAHCQLSYIIDDEREIHIQIVPTLLGKERYRITSKSFKERTGFEIEDSGRDESLILIIDKCGIASYIEVMLCEEGYYRVAVDSGEWYSVNYGGAITEEPLTTFEEITLDYDIQNPTFQATTLNLQMDFDIYSGKAVMNFWYF